MNGLQNLWAFIGVAVLLALLPQCFSAPEGTDAAPQSVGPLVCSEKYLWKAAKDVPTVSVSDKMVACRELVKVADNVSERAFAAFVRVSSLLAMEGYRHERTFYEIARILELRGATDSVSIEERTDEVWKVYTGTKHRVTPADLLQLLRAMGPGGGAKLNRDGFFYVAAMVNEAKRQNGE